MGRRQLLLLLLQQAVLRWSLCVGASDTAAATTATGGPLRRSIRTRSAPGTLRRGRGGQAGCPRRHRPTRRGRHAALAAGGRRGRRERRTRPEAQLGARAVVVFPVMV